MGTRSIRRLHDTGTGAVPSSKKPVRGQLAAALALALVGGSVCAADYNAGTEAQLIKAINDANAHPGIDQIHITADITLTQALPLVSDALTIRGIGGKRAIRRDDSGANSCSPTATNAFRLIDASADLTLQDLVLSGGCNLVDQGGAVRVQQAALRLEDSTVTGSQTFVDNPNYVYGAGVGGGVAALYGSLTLVDSIVSGNATHGNLAAGGGAAAFASDLQVVRSTISGNHANGPGAYGGGVYATNYPVLASVTVSDSVFANNSTSGAYANGGGLAVFNGSSTIVNSQFTGNSVSGYIDDRGGGINIIASSTATTRIDRCTISNNSISTSDSAWGAGLRVGGGLISISSSSVFDNRIDAGYKARGGGMWFEVADATLTNTTVSGNVISGSSAQGGGLAIISEAPRLMTLAVYNSTIAGNEANGGIGGGLAIKMQTDDSVPPAVDLESTILAGNLGQGGLDGIAASVDASGTVVARHSLIQGSVNVGSGAYTPDTTTLALAGQDPLLLPLADNGGPTLTQALAAGSPAINRGTNAHGLLFDQRGPGHPRAVGGVADIGAYERKQ
jgi:hypothetical protein